MAHDCGFELAGVAAAEPHADVARFENWRGAGMAGEMAYLAGRRGDLRHNPRHLLASARTMLCVGKLYNRPEPHSTEFVDRDRGWISRYAWGTDYHDSMRVQLNNLAARIAAEYGGELEYRVCIDTAPLLERSYARTAGLGWIGKNTCLINQAQGSWFFLGEILLSAAFEPDSPPPDRCGTCRRCIDACPTNAIVPDGGDGWTLDARLCISYLTIEKRGLIPEQLQSKIRNHIFGCDICQDVCPWNGRAPVSGDASFGPTHFAPHLEIFAELTEEEFRTWFRKSPVWRSKYAGFLRNVAIAMGNSGNARYLDALEKLELHTNAAVVSAAKEALRILAQSL